MRRTLVSIILVIAMILSLMGCGSGTAVAKRSILAEDVTGSVLSATDSESNSIAKGEKLKSERYLLVSGGANLTMLLDSDKHVYAGEETKLYLAADGKEGSTRTKIELLEGLLICGIDNKLNAEETFEVTTNNATLSVRGTVFTTKVSKDATGKTTTVLDVSEGSIEVSTIEDGETKTVTVAAGESHEFAGKAPEPLEHTSGAIASASAPGGGNLTSSGSDANTANASSGSSALAAITAPDGVPVPQIPKNFTPEDFDNELFHRNGPEVDARFADYEARGYIMNDWNDPVTHEQLVYRIARGTIYYTRVLYPDIFKQYEGQDYEGAHRFTIVFSEPVTMTDGRTITYAELCTDGDEHASVNFDEFPIGEEMDVYGWFDFFDNGPATIDGKPNLNNIVFGEKACSFAIHDYRW